MEIKKGKVLSLGELEQTKNGAHLLHATIQIGVDKTFNRYTGAQEDQPECVDYTFWHDEARNAAQQFGVGDVVEIEISHYVDKQWHRTNVITRNIKLVKKAEQQAAPSADGQAAQPVATAQPIGAKAAEGDDLPF